MSRETSENLGGVTAGPVKKKRYLDSTLPPEVEAVLEAAIELCHEDHWGNNNCCQCNLCVAVLAWVQKDKRNELKGEKPDEE